MNKPERPKKDSVRINLTMSKPLFVYYYRESNKIGVTIQTLINITLKEKQNESENKVTI